MATCEPLNLDGRTPENPCKVWLLPGWPDDWRCNWNDFTTVRELLNLEHNALVRNLNRWNKLVKEGKVKWTPIPTTSWALYEESYALLEKYPDSLAKFMVSPGMNLVTAVTSFISMAMKVHSAVCDMDKELEAIGEPLPQKPTKPEPGPEKKGLIVEAIDFAREVGQGILTLAVVGVVGFLGYTVINQRLESRDRMRLAAASRAPTPAPTRVTMPAMTRRAS